LSDVLHIRIPIYPVNVVFSVERQSVRMSKITNDGSTRSGTGCFIDAHMWQQWSSKG